MTPVKLSVQPNSKSTQVDIRNQFYYVMYSTYIATLYCGTVVCISTRFVTCVHPYTMHTPALSQRLRRRAQHIRHPM